MRLLIHLVFCIGLFSLGHACKKPQETTSFPVEVTVQTPTQEPLESATLLVNDKRIGTTDRGGRITFEINGRVNEAKTLAVVCPTGYHSIEEADAVSLRLREFSAIGAEQKTRSLRHSFLCSPEKVTVAVMVSASGEENLPVIYEGQTLARTNKNGFAHIAFQARPNEKLTLLISTEDNSRLQPQNPTKTLQIGPGNAVYTFEQSFEKKIPKPRHNRPRRPKLVPMPIR